MKRIAFAVVREDGANYSFNKWHDQKEDALAEAERLAKKEKRTFLVLKLVGYSAICDIPIDTKAWD